jgi:hypothetical protein
MAALSRDRLASWTQVTPNPECIAWNTFADRSYHVT